SSHPIDSVGRGALLGYVRADAAEPAKTPFLVKARARRHFPPPFVAANMNRKQQIAKRLALLEPVGEIAQPGRKIPRFPCWAGENLEERHAVDLQRVEPNRMAEAWAGTHNPACR